MLFPFRPRSRERLILQRENNSTFLLQCSIAFWLFSVYKLSGAELFKAGLK